MKALEVLKNLQEIDSGESETEQDILDSESDVSGQFRSDSNDDSIDDEDEDTYHENQVQSTRAVRRAA